MLAALLADIESDGEGNPIDPSAPQIHELRMTLGALSSQADESQWDEMSDLQLTEETCSTPDFYYGNTPTTSSLDSDSSGSSKDSFSSPLGFLQAALPHVSVQRLSQALADAEGNERDMDMWDIVATILTDESVREMEERGFAGLEDIEMGSMPPDDEIMWETVEKKKKPEQAKATKGKSSRSTKFTLVDVRQQQHRRPSKKGSAVHLLPDLWTQVSSLSAHLESLLPPHPSSFFQSYFHSPEYTTPYDALSAALTAISISQTPSTSDIHTSILFNLLDVLLPEYEDVDSLQRSRLISDTELSVKVTNGRGDDALDLVKLLRDLDSDSSSYLEMGIYHLPAPSPTKDFVIKRSLPAGPPIPQPPPPSTSRLRPPSPIAKKPSRFQWQDVPQRKIVDRAPHPLSPHIPAYSRDVNGIKVRGGGNGLGKGGKGDVGELAESRRRMTESMKKRNELLREASRMWQRGNARTRGGEVAFYFAEKVGHFPDFQFSNLAYFRMP